MITQSRYSTLHEMRSLNAIALFCEDIRAEEGGTLTLVGLLPDNLDLAPMGPTAKWLGRFAIYIRVNFSPKENIGSARLRLVGADGQIHEFGNIPAETIETAREAAMKKGNALAGVITRTVLPGTLLQQLGTMRVEVVIDEETYVAGALTVQKQPIIPPISSTAH
jgi:uncharacterized protein DUF6941